MVKTFKNFLLQNRECLGAESLHKSSGMRDLPKLLIELSYVDIWPFYGGVKFASLCICMSLIHLNGKIVENFKFLFLWSNWAKFAQISYWAFLSQGNERLLKWSRSIDQDGNHAHNMVRPFKNLLQNWGCLGAKSVHKSSGTGDLLKLLKRLSYVDIWPFYGKVKFASLCICMSPITFIWENCWEFDDFCEATEPKLLRFLAHLSMKCSCWAIVVSQCPSSIMGHAVCVMRREQLL